MTDCISRGSIRFGVTRIPTSWITRVLEDPKNLVKGKDRLRSLGRAIHPRGLDIPMEKKSCVWIASCSQTRSRAIITRSICQHAPFPFHPRSIAKMSALRVLRSLTASSSRAVSARALAHSTHVSRLGSQLAPRTAAPTARWFSASARVMGDGSCKPCRPSLHSFVDCSHTADLALSQRLAEELKYEQEATTEAEEPEFLTAFKKRDVWQVSIIGFTVSQHVDVM